MQNNGFLTSSLACYEQDVSKVLAYKLLYHLRVMQPVAYIEDLEALFADMDVPKIDQHDEIKGRVVSRLRQNDHSSVGDPAWHAL
jgi:hypothetical protein